MCRESDATIINGCVSVCLCGYEKGMSEGYTHEFDLKTFYFYFLLMGQWVQYQRGTRVYGHPSSHKLNILDITMILLQRTFIFIVTENNCLFNHLIM